MFYIRADGNEKIGMGHIMRCLTVADALRKQGEEVLFLTADEKPVKFIEERGFAAKILFTYYDEMEVGTASRCFRFYGKQRQRAAGKAENSGGQLFCDGILSEKSETFRQSDPDG